MWFDVLNAHSPNYINCRQATRPVEQHQHQAAQSGYHNRNDRTTSTQHGDAVFRNREFSTHHHGYAHDAPSQSPIHPNEGNPHVTYDRSRNPYQFIHSTPHSRMGWAASATGTMPFAPTMIFFDIIGCSFTETIEFEFLTIFLWNWILKKWKQKYLAAIRLPRWKFKLVKPNCIIFHWKIV